LTISGNEEGKTSVGDLKVDRVLFEMSAPGISQTSMASSNFTTKLRIQNAHFGTMLHAAEC
jgi:hypothetical protein